jgi:hypothetical protein
VVFILVCAIVTNVTVNLKFAAAAEHFPFLGAAIWVALLVAVPLRKPEWSLVPGAFKGSIFLLSLVTCASMMPVESLPPASWPSALALGFISAVFDNIPLTALALKQGGYDWGFLAYAVGFGGSMLWFGSSAGVAVANLFPEAKSVGQWLRHGWFIPVGYVVGFFALLVILGWHPHEKHQGCPGCRGPGAKGGAHRCTGTGSGRRAGLPVSAVTRLAGPAHRRLADGLDCRVADAPLVGDRVVLFPHLVSTPTGSAPSCAAISSASTDGAGNRPIPARPKVVSSALSSNSPTISGARSWVSSQRSICPRSALPRVGNSSGALSRLSGNPLR